MRKCTACRFTKPLAAFPKGSGDNAKCNQCRNDTRNETNRMMRERVILSLGGSCVCCGETEQVFLDIDHLNNDGAKDRKETSAATWSLAFREPERFQILCRNCNWAKHALRSQGGCPHQRKG